MSLNSCISDFNTILNSPAVIVNKNIDADWLPGEELNIDLRNVKKITKNWQYRKYITDNADKIIKQNQLHACQQCCSCPARYPSLDVFDNQRDTTSKTTPYLYDKCLSQVRPPGFEENVQKKTYLMKQDLKSRMTIPSLSNHQLIQRGIH